jgi:plastocyanin
MTWIRVVSCFNIYCFSLMKHQGVADIERTPGDHMGDIKIQKTTALLVASLVLVLVFGAYTVMSAPAQGAANDGSGSQVRGTSPSDSSGGVSAGGTTVGTSIDDQTSAGTKDVQDVYIRAKNDGTYDKGEVTVKAGSPVRLHFTADPDAGCGRQMVIYGLNVKAISKSGEEDIVEFTPQKAGTYEYNCGMRMWRPGKLVVV